MMKTITMQYLKDQQACPEQVELFAEIFGLRAELSRENLLKAALANLNISWLAPRLLTGPELGKYNKLVRDADITFAIDSMPATLVREAIVAPAWLAFEASRKAAYEAFIAGGSCDAYDETVKLAERAYNEAVAPAHQFFNETVAPARLIRDTITANAFADAWGLP